MATIDLTKADIRNAIVKQSTPMLLGITAVFSISLVDTYFVGKLGTKELAALSFTFPVTMAIASLSAGLGAGAASIVSRTIGEGEQSHAKRLSTDSLIFSSLFVTLLSTIGFFTVDPLFSLLGAKGETLALISQYMKIWYLSMPFLVIPMVANAVIRSVGNAKWPGIIMVVSALINIGLTPLFIFGYGPVPAMHIEGAAISTAIARIFTFVLALYVIYKHEDMLLICLPSLSQFINSVTKVIKIALPAAAGSVVNPLAIGVVTGLLASYGDNVVAAFGVGTRIESFASIPLLALSAAIGPIVGQNWGADQKGRVIQSIKYWYSITLIWAFSVTVGLYFLAPSIASIIASDSSVADIASSYLLVVSSSIAGYGFVIISAAAFNALGKSTTGLAHYLVRGFVLYVPLSWLATLWFDYQWVFYAIATSNIVSGIFVATYTLYWLKVAKKNDCEPNAFSFQ